MSKVSIIVPCYKLGKYLPEALDSVLAQDYADWDCIIVNDGSPDSTAEVAANYCAKDSRFKSLDLENGGVIRARNKGVEASTGDYLLFLDADDILFPDYIGKAVRAMEENPALLVVSGPVEQFGDASGMIEIPPFSKDTMLARNSLHVSSMIRRADFDRAGGFNPEMAEGLEDWDLFLGILEKDGDVLILDTPVLKYRIRKSSRNKGISPEAMADIRRKLWEHHKELYAKYFLNPADTVEYRKLSYRIGKLEKLPGLRVLEAFKKLFR